MTQPGLDVIVPCYDYGRYLEACIGSVLEEARLDLRILIIDDASPDGSGEQADRIASADPRVRVIRHQVNRGHIATYNEGIDWVEAPYMLLLSADDMVAPGALFRAVDLMERRPEVAFVYGEAIRFSHEDELPTPPFAVTAETVTSGHDFIRGICDHARNPVETATAVVRTRVQKAVGGYRPELPHSGDLEMWLRCATRGDVGYIQAPQAWVRMHGKNMRQGYYGDNFVADCLQRHEAFRLFFRDFAAGAPEPAKLQRRVRGRLAEEMFDAAREWFAHDLPHERLLASALRFDPALRLRPAYARMVLKSGLRRAAGDRGWRLLQAWKQRAGLRGSGKALQGHEERAR